MIWGQEWERSIALQSREGHWWDEGLGEENKADAEHVSPDMHVLNPGSVGNYQTAVCSGLVRWLVISHPRSHTHQTQFFSELDDAKFHYLVEVVHLLWGQWLCGGTKSCHALNGRNVKKIKIQRVKWLVQANTVSTNVCRVIICTSCLSLMHLMV